MSSYTPTLYNTTNISSSTAYLTSYYSADGFGGSFVHVWGEIDIDATTASIISELGMDLPFGTAATQSFDLAGTGAFEDNTIVKINYDSANARAKFRFIPQTSSNNRYSFHFTYKYIPT